MQSFKITAAPHLGSAIAVNDLRKPPLFPKKRLLGTASPDLVEGTSLIFIRVKAPGAGAALRRLLHPVLRLRRHLRGADRPGPWERDL